MVYQESYTCSYSLDFQGGDAGKTIMSHSNTFTPWFGLKEKITFTLEDVLSSDKINDLLLVF